MSATPSVSGAEPGGVLVATKLHVPRLRSGLVPRPELVAGLIAAEGCRLVLICAPAGWGKSVLLSEWVASPEETRPFAWVSLDRADSDPVRFWGYVIAALRTVGPELGETAQAALPVAGPNLVDAVVTPLINDLAASSRRLVLVLDDYHFVRSEPIHASVGFLLRHLPHNVQLAVATRADPPWPLAGLRAAGEIAEIRAAGLRFSDLEADALMNGSLGLGLDQADVQQLQTRTEGWVTGLQLAALSLQAHPDRHAFVQQFAGDDRQIGDYLHEVLADQPASLRDFLLRTSILERLSAPLCDAVTGTGDAAELLDAIERANLFLVSLDTRREWYRYHHLFRDLLRQALERTEPASIVELHRRAAAWYREQGDVDAAIAHATAAGSVEDARKLIGAHWEERSALGEHETVIRWIEALPLSTVQADANLCIAQAWSELRLDRLEEAASWRLRWESTEAGPAGKADEDSPQFPVVSFDVAYAEQLGDVGRACEAARVAVDSYRDETDPRRAFASANLGVCLYWAGDLDSAAACLGNAVRRLADAEPSLLISQALLHGHSYLAAIRADLGELDRAERSAAEAERLTDRFPPDGFPWGQAVHVARGKLFELRGDFAAAEASFTQAETLARRTGWTLDHAHSLLLLARLKHRLRKHIEARALVREAREVLWPCPDPGMLRELLERTERSLQLTRAHASPPALPVDVELSERELTILRLLATDLSQREIGSELYVSFNTVKAHMRSIFRKLGVSSRADAVVRGRELNLL